MKKKIVVIGFGFMGVVHAKNIIASWKLELCGIVDNRDGDIFAGIESRGFIIACALALKYNKGMILVRKAGKLPGKVVKTSYTLEYGKATLEIQKDVIQEGQRVLICDDLLATGGTAKAAAKLIEKINGTIVGFAFIIELLELNGRDKIKDYRSESLVEY